jgi:hypothetical protein
MFYRAVTILFGAILTVPLCAEPTCASGNLSGLVGTTCAIGSLDFDFTSFSGNQDMVGSTLGTAWTASQFHFTALSNGFSLSLVSSGGTSVTGPGTSGNATDSATLFYNVVDPTGTITGETVNGGGFSAAGGSYSQGGAGGTTACSPSCGSNNVYSNILVQDAFSLVGPLEGPTGLCAGFVCTVANGNPFSSGTGSAMIFDLTASELNTASWDGNTATSFTFTTGPLPGVPEPRYTVLLLGIGFLALQLISGRRQDV